jgi:hypothetical protein
MEWFLWDDGGMRVDVSLWDMFQAREGREVGGDIRGDIMDGSPASFYGVLLLDD